MEKRIKGFFCPNCHGRRLHAVTTKRAAPFIIIRYRECDVCNYRLKTRELVESSNKQTTEHIAKRLKSRRARLRKMKKCATT